MSGVMDRLREVAERHAQRPRRAFEETMLVLDSLVGDVHAIEKMTSESEGLVWDEVAYEAAKSLFHPGNIDGVHASAAAALNPSVSAAAVIAEASGAHANEDERGRVRQGKRKRKHASSGGGGDGAGDVQRESYHRLLFAWVDRVLLNMHVGVSNDKSLNTPPSHGAEAMLPFLVLEMMHALCGTRGRNQRSTRTEKLTAQRQGYRQGKRHSRRRSRKNTTLLSDADAERVLVFARRVMEPAFHRLQNAHDETNTWARLLMVLANTWRVLLAPENGERVGLSAGQIHALWERDESLRRDMHAHASEACRSRNSGVGESHVAVCICRLMMALTDIDSSSMHEQSLLVNAMTAALVCIGTVWKGTTSSQALNAHTHGEVLLLRLFRISSTRPLQLETLIREFVHYFSQGLRLDGRDFFLGVPFEDSIQYMAPTFFKDVFAIVAQQPQSRSAELIDSVCTTFFRSARESAANELTGPDFDEVCAATASLVICGDFLGTILDALPLDSTNKAQVLERIGDILESKDGKQKLLLDGKSGRKNKHLGTKYMRMRVYKCLIGIAKECLKPPPRQIGERLRTAEGGIVVDDATAPSSISTLPWYDRPMQLLVPGVGGATPPEDIAKDIRARTSDLQALLADGAYRELLLSDEMFMGDVDGKKRSELDSIHRIFNLEFAMNAMSVMVQTRAYITSIQYSRNSILCTQRSLRQAGKVIDVELKNFVQVVEQLASLITSSICSFVRLKIRIREDVLGFRATLAWNSLLTNLETLSEYADEKSLMSACKLITKSLTASNRIPSPWSSVRAASASLRADPFFYSSQRIRSVLPRAMCVEMRRSCRDLLECIMDGAGFDIIKGDLPLYEESRGSEGSPHNHTLVRDSDEPTSLITELRILTKDMSETYYRGDDLFPKYLIEDDMDTTRARIDVAVHEYVGILNLIRDIPNGYLGQDTNAKTMACMLLSELHISACLLHWIQPSWAFVGLIQVVSSLLATSATVIGCYGADFTARRTRSRRNTDADVPYLLKWVSIIVKLVADAQAKICVEHCESMGFVRDQGNEDSKKKKKKKKKKNKKEKESFGGVFVKGDDISGIQDSVADFVRGVIALVVTACDTADHENAHVIGVVDDMRRSLDDSAKACAEGYCSPLNTIAVTRANVIIARGFLEWASDEARAVDVNTGGRTLAAWIQRCCEELGRSVHTLLQAVSLSVTASYDDGKVRAHTDELYRCLSLATRVCRPSAEPSSAVPGRSSRTSSSSCLDLLPTGSNIASSCRRIVALVKTVPFPSSSASTSEIPSIHIPVAGSLIYIAESMLALSSPRFAVGDPINEQPEVCQRLTTMLVFLHQRLDVMTASFKAVVEETTRQYISLLSLAVIYHFYRQLKELLASSTRLGDGSALGVLRVLSLAIDVHARRKDVSNLVALATEGIAVDLVALAYRSIAPDCDGDMNAAVIAELLGTFSRVCQRVNHFAMTPNDIADTMQATITILSRCCFGGHAMLPSRLDALLIAECCCEMQKSVLLFRPQTMRCLAFLTAFSRACLRCIVHVDDDDSMDDDHGDDARRAPSTRTMGNGWRSVSTAAAEVDVARSLASLYAALSTHSTTVTLYATHILADIVSTTVTANTMPEMHLSSATASALSPGVYALLDLLTAREMQLLYATLGVGVLGKLRQDALRNLKREYEREHKYTGKI